MDTNSFITKDSMLASNDGAAKVIIDFQWADEEEDDSSSSSERSSF
jgi:hypothetical protein